MPPTAPQVFTNIDPDQFASLLRRANDAGLALEGYSGLSSKFGVDVAWDYSPDLKQLTIQCLSAPFFISRNSVDDRIRGMVLDTIRSAA